MAETPFGLRPVGHLNGSGSFSGKLREYPLAAAALGQPLVLGNPVALAATGIVECGLAAGAAGDASAQAVATSYVGVFAGVRRASASDALPAEDQIISGTPAAGDKALVWDDPQIVWECITEPQASGAAVAPVVGEAYAFGDDVDSAAAVNVALKRSRLSVAVAAAVNNGPVKCLEVVEQYSDDTNTWWKIKVIFNAGHQLLSTADLA